MADLDAWTAREILRLREELDALYSRLCDDFGLCDLPGALAGGPRMEIVERPGGLEVVVDLPGVDPECLRVELADDRLTVSCERTRAVPGPGGGVVQRSAATRTLRLPCRVDVEQVEAELAEGRLTITLPRCGQAQRRLVPVRRR